MKYKFKNEFENVIIGTLSDYVTNDQEVTKLDKDFIRGFSYFNNFDGGYDAIEIMTNETEMSFFIRHIILQYKDYLESKGYVITKDN